ncbi:MULTISPECIES: carbohydrate-binding protein [unclassified Microcoleus]|uniref:carbohydrate-binding protein n=1 Tax=unclassified Microcoleus TaxID=2642155 RepID=UPI002FCF731D
MSKNGFPIKRRKFMTISVSAGIGLAIPSLIHSHEDDRAEAVSFVPAVILALSTSFPVLSTLCGVAKSILKDKLEEVKQEYGITASNNRGSIIAITPRKHLEYSTEKARISNYLLESSVGKNLLEQPTNIANVPPAEKWNKQQAEFYINGSFGKKVNQSERPQLKLWALNASYKVGEVIAFQDKKYKCRQLHTVYADNWIPPNTPALWELIPSQ